LLPSEDDPEIVCTVEDSEETLLGETGVLSVVVGVPGEVEKYNKDIKYLNQIIQYLGKVEYCFNNALSIHYRTTLIGNRIIVEPPLLSTSFLLLLGTKSFCSQHGSIPSNETMILYI
jgi:hypothetical protein